MLLNGMKIKSGQVEGFDSLPGGTTKSPLRKHRPVQGSGLFWIYCKFYEEAVHPNA